jgi:hypothetical protein
MSRDDVQKDLTEVDVSPDMGMYRILPQQGYNPAFALAEFIDNAIHAYQHKNHKRKESLLTITLNFFTNEYDKKPVKRNSIEILDNGPGMQRSELADAFKPAKKPMVEGLSEFGIGMKAASVWFTDTWELTSKSHNEELFHSVDFNLPNLLSEGTSRISVRDESENEYIGAHGTAIFLRDLRSRRQFDKSKANSICNALAEIYQRYTNLSTSKGLLILKASIDGSPPKELKYQAHSDNTILISPFNKTVNRQGAKGYYAIGPERRWYKDIEFDFTHEEVTTKVKGFIYILKTGRYGAENPGLVLFRNGRVIRGTHEDDFKPEALYLSKNKYRGQRLYGELEIDGLPVTYTKDDIDFEEDEFVEQMLKDPEVLLFCKQCDNYRAEKDEKDIKFVASEDDITSAANSNNKSDSGQKQSASKKSTVKKTTKTSTKKTKSERHLDYLELLKSSEINSLGMTSFISEFKYQIIAARAVSAALCLRVVIEKGLLARIEKDFSCQYPKIASMGVQSLVNYMASNKNIFFAEPSSQKAFKCVQVNSKSSDFGDVLVLNNVSHGSYNPSVESVENMLTNFEPLLNWAYKIHIS